MESAAWTVIMWSHQCFLKEMGNKNKKTAWSSYFAERCSQPMKALVTRVLDECYGMKAEGKKSR